MTEQVPLLRRIAAGEAVLLGLAAVSNLFMMALTGVDVVGRYLVDAPVPGAFELTKYAMGVAVFSALPVVALRRAHVNADLISGMVGPHVRRGLSVLADMFGLALFVLLAWRLSLEANQLANYGTVAGVLRLPLAPLAYYSAVLSALTALVYAYLLVPSRIRERVR